MAGELISVQPGEVIFQFELRKQISCSLQLANPTENIVAFKVKTTSPKKYSVRPNTGIIYPGATCNVTVTMQAQRDAPPDMQCKDKFLIQSVVVTDGTQQAEVSPDLFNKQPGKEVHETKLRVVYLSPPQPPSPVPESAEEGVSPRPSQNLENGFQTANNTLDLQSKLAEVATAGTHSNMAVQSKASTGFSFLFVLIVGLLGVLVGYFLRS